jgi:hypothetical protein
MHVPANPFHAGTDQRIAHRLAHKNLFRHCEGRDARPDVHGETGEVVAVAFDLAQMEAGSHIEAKCRGLGADHPSDLDRHGRTRDHDEEVITAGVHFPRLGPRRRPPRADRRDPRPCDVQTALSAQGP